MRICVLVALPEQLSQAGVRIRYGRIRSHLSSLGHRLDIRPIDSFASQDAFDHDIYLVSKCYDSRSLLVADRLADRGCLIGVDLFDDYFSQREDSRLGSYRVWLKSFLRFADFILCSTVTLSEVAHSYAPKLPIHILNDPSPSVDIVALPAALEHKYRMAMEKKQLSLAWFGIGDNYYFPVGLRDLVAFAGGLGELRQRGFEAPLEILTNMRALTPENLTMLRRLPLPYDIQEWTEEREKALLARSLACFLPVNAQNFSAAKSPNRAVTALSMGVQVISAGYPLYDRLSPFLYRNPRDLVCDIEAGAPLVLNSKTASQLLSYLGRYSPEKEAKRLVNFFSSVLESSKARLSGQRSDRGAVLFGNSFPRFEHQFATRMKSLRVALPFCRRSFKFDVRLGWREGGGVDVLLARKYFKQLKPEVADLFARRRGLGKPDYVQARLEDILPEADFRGTALWQVDLPSAFSASYPYIFGIAEAVIKILFPGTVCVHSENSDLPWHITLSGAAIVPEAA